MPVARQHALAIDPHANTVDAADLEPRGARVRALDARRGVCDAAIAVPRGRVEPDPVAPGAVLTPFELAAVRTLLLDLGPRAVDDDESALLNDEPKLDENAPMLAAFQLLPTYHAGW